jgi:hypothetical protein
MQLALEIPKQLLTEVSPVLDMDFALAHLVLQDEVYRNFYKAQRSAGRFVIMDNGFHELGHPLSEAELWKAAELIRPSVVVSPDRLGDAFFTLDAFSKMERLRPKDMDTGIGIVLCGKTYDERITVFDKTSKRASMILLPFREPRMHWFAELIDARMKTSWPPRIHLLGVKEFAELAKFRTAFLSLGIQHWRVSVDTGKPIKFALAGKRFEDKTELRGLAAQTLDKAVTPKQLLDIYYNIAFMRRFL